MEIPSLRETSLASPATGLKTSSQIPKAQRSQLVQAGHPVCAEVVRQIKVPVKPSFLLHPTS